MRFLVFSISALQFTNGHDRKQQLYCRYIAKSCKNCTTPSGLGFLSSEMMFVSSKYIIRIQQPACGAFYPALAIPLRSRLRSKRQIFECWLGAWFEAVSTHPSAQARQFLSRAG
jgi:hypothetical protein